MPFFEHARPHLSLVPDRDRAKTAPRRAAALVARSRLRGGRILGRGRLVRGSRGSALPKRLGAAAGAAYRYIRGFQPGDFDRMLTRCADGPRARLQLRQAARPRTRNSKTRLEGRVCNTGEPGNLIHGRMRFPEIAA